VASIAHNTNREVASSMVTAGAPANTTKGNSRVAIESALFLGGCSHSHGESVWEVARTVIAPPSSVAKCL